MLGELVVTSGQIVACDLLAIPEMLPFADTVPSGRYPVIVSAAPFLAGYQCLQTWVSLVVWRTSVYATSVPSTQPRCKRVDSRRGIHPPLKRGFLADFL
jgi:hypothetical protein